MSEFERQVISLIRALDDAKAARAKELDGTLGSSFYDGRITGIRLALMTLNRLPESEE